MLPSVTYRQHELPTKFGAFLGFRLIPCGKVRISDEEPMQGFMEDLQKTQNKMFRLLNNTRIKDRITTKSIMVNLNMLSANQINAQVKLTEIWKSRNVEKYPIFSQKLNYDSDSRCTRASVRGDLVSEASTGKSQATFSNDAIKIWNTAPTSIKSCITLAAARKEIRKFVTTLPV